MTHKIKITPRAEDPRFSIVELDGIDISQYVHAVRIALVAGESAVVALELVPLEVEIPSEILAQITADDRESGLEDENAYHPE